MAIIAVQVQSLLNTALYDTYVTSDTVTVQTLKNYIYANTSVSAAWYQLYYSGELLANANTLSSYSIGNVQIRSANRISDLATRELRQRAKLDLAALDRAESSNPRATYDLTLLPTQFDSNAVVNNPNAGGLVTGRPWTTAPGDAAGLFKTTYAGYFAEDVNFFATATPTTFGANPATSVQTTVIEEPNSEDGELFSVQWLGYFKPTTTETHTFFLNSDDASYMWIGATAVTGFTTGNALINNGGAHAPVEVSGSIALTAGQYYPVRIQFGEAGGGDELQFNYETPTIAKTTTVTGKVFYNSATNGF
jgi:hypothetical protein